MMTYYREVAEMDTYPLSLTVADNIIKLGIPASATELEQIYRELWEADEGEWIDNFFDACLLFHPKFTKKVVNWDQEVRLLATRDVIAAVKITLAKNEGMSLLDAFIQVHNDQHLMNYYCRKRKDGPTGNRTLGLPNSRWAP